MSNNFVITKVTFLYPNLYFPILEISDYDFAVRG
jgi:hypothetical protein